jgi:hypothetical protein
MLRRLARFFFGDRTRSTFDAAKARDPYMDVLRQLQSDAPAKARPSASGVSRTVLHSAQSRARVAEPLPKRSEA